MRRSEIIVLAGVLLFSAGMVVCSVQGARHRAAKMEWKHRLREIGLGLHNDQGSSGKVPSKFTTEGNGNPSLYPDNP